MFTLGFEKIAGLGSAIKRMNGLNKGLANTTESLASTLANNRVRAAARAEKMTRIKDKLSKTDELLKKLKE